MKSNFYKEMAYPFIVLVVIALVAAALLGITNNFTAPVIEENARIEAENTRKAVLPEATSFVEVAVEEGMNVDSIYKDEGGSGYVITAGSKGYGGNVVVTIGFSNEGEIVGISADASSETQGVGSKTGQQAHLDKFLGRTEAPGDDSSVLIASATLSSRAFRTAVNNAYAALAMIQ